MPTPTYEPSRDPSGAEVPVLTFRDVVLCPERAHQRKLTGVSFRLVKGDLMLVYCESESTRLPLADGALGLLDPEEGTIEFRGFDWSAADVRTVERLRGSVTRVWSESEPNWIENLSVRENVLLAQLHHSSRALEDVAAEAASIARRCGLEELTDRSPSSVSEADLRRAALVRAFLGTPDLILLECPLRGIFQPTFPVLRGLIRDARARGAAVVWITERVEVFEAGDLDASLRFEVIGSSMVPAE